LGEYNKANLKKQHFPIEATEKAIDRCRLLDQPTSQTDIPSSNTSRVYLLLEAIFAVVLTWQRPEGMSSIPSNG
jgi:hypothetical protein